MNYETDSYRENYNDSAAVEDYLSTHTPEQELRLKRIGLNRFREKKVLDFGCGAGHLLEFIEAKKLNHIDYIGLDISPKFTALCRTKWPERDFIETDILINQNQLPTVDYLIMNGVFTEKRGIKHQNFRLRRRNVASFILSLSLKI